MRNNKDIKEQLKNKKQAYYILYIIQYGNTCQYKIGITKNLNSRLSNLQCGSPYELKVIKIWTHTQKHIIEQYERVIHRYLNKQGYQIRKDSEWYRLCKPILKLLTSPNSIKEQNEVIDFIHKGCIN